MEREFRHFSAKRSFTTVFIGGGTPGLLDVGQISRLGEIINSQKFEASIEWSVEIAPSEISIDKLEAWKKIGVNRISLGVQTFDSGLMNALGRMHTVERAIKAYEMVREVGFDSVNLDLIFGVPGQTISSWKSDLLHAVNLKPDHISTYCLTFEEDTALFVKLSQGKIKVDPDQEAKFYQKAWELLPDKGYFQYEISNFAKDGHQCIHNLNTWAMNEWIGFGPSAASQIDGGRRKNLSNLELWAKQWQNSTSLKFEEEENLVPEDFAFDAVCFGLRMNKGIDLKQIGMQFKIPENKFTKIKHFLEVLEKENLATNSGRWKLTDKGRILADSVACNMPALN